MQKYIEVPIRVWYTMDGEKVNVVRIYLHNRNITEYIIHTEQFDWIAEDLTSVRYKVRTINGCKYYVTDEEFYTELDVEIGFDYQPEEPMVRYYSDGSGYPGCGAEVNIYEVTLINARELYGTNILDDLQGLYGEGYKERLEEEILEYID